jgi:hypothetical protein
MDELLAKSDDGLRREMSRPELFLPPNHLRLSSRLGMTAHDKVRNLLATKINKGFSCTVVEL